MMTILSLTYLILGAGILTGMLVVGRPRLHPHEWLLIPLAAVIWPAAVLAALLLPAKPRGTMTCR